jgi:UDP-N-acetylmuramyl pentapeptide phosphotransferase/UDP-N-acetylglucosamine-1-phosphate transferase
MIFVYYSIFHFTFYLSYLLNKKIHNYDVPSKTKKHKKKVITSGGLLPFLLLAVLIIYLFYQNFGIISYRTENIPFFLSIPIGIFILTIVSFLDDLKNISIKLRLSIQFIVVFFSISALPFDTDFIIKIATFDVKLNIKICIFLSIVLWIYFINATNFYDGADGLIGSQLINFGLSYFIIYKKIGLFFISEISLLILLIGISFLFFNFSKKKKMFLGDTGSIVSGYLFGFLSISLILDGYYLAPILISFTMAFDIFLSLLSRIYNKKSIFIRHDDFIFKKIIKKSSLKKYLFILILIQSILSLYAIQSIR